jgi:hypothetical protein
MKNIEKYNQIETRVQKNNFGNITTLKVKTGISEHGSINFEDKTLLANYIYNEDSYNLVYTIVDSDGNAGNSYMESDGILPTLFKSPDNEIYVSTVPYHPDKEMEISVPLFNRENIENPKPNRPFTGKFIGNINQSSIFHDTDIWSDKKPDKMLRIEFKNGVIKKKHNIKIDFPKNNKVCIKNNEIHLIATENDQFIHRQIDETGKEINVKKINRKGKNFREALKLSFEEVSCFIAGEENGKFILIEIDNKGNLTTKELIDIQDPIFNTWRPVEIFEDTYVIRFNTEFGNGWFTLRQDKLIEFFYSKNTQGYRNLLSGEIVAMEYKDLVISGINKTKDNSYAVVFYPMTDRIVKNKELIILSRTIK